MGGLREKAVKYPEMDRQFIETMSGKPNEGGAYNFLTGSSAPKGGGNVKKGPGPGPTIWDSVEKVWNFLFKGGSLAPPPRPVQVTPEPRYGARQGTPEELKAAQDKLDALMPGVTR